MGILFILALILGVAIVVIIISFFISVPQYLESIEARMYERNKIEKEKLEIMKNNKNNDNM